MGLLIASDGALCNVVSPPIVSSMTFDEFLRLYDNAKSTLKKGTGVSYPTLRKMERREPVRLDVAYKVAMFIGCDPFELANPKPKRVRKRNARRKAKEVRT